MATERSTSSPDGGWLRGIESLLDHHRASILYAGYYLALVSVFLRVADYYFFDASDGQGEQAWLIFGLLAAYSLLTVSRHWPPRRHAMSHAYLAVQSLLVVSLLLIEPSQDYFAVLFFLLSAEAMLSLRLSVGFAWIAVFAALTAVAMLSEYGLSPGIGFSLLYAGGMYFFGAFAAATARAERAREETEDAYAELSRQESALVAHERDMAVLEERNRLAREMHDTLAQGFTGIVLQLEAAEHALPDGEGSVAHHLAAAKGLARESLQEARRSVWDLRSPALNAGSLEAALRTEVTSLGVNGPRIEFVTAGRPLPVTPEIEKGLLRVCQEALTNVRRHAHAESVEVGLTYDATSVVLRVRDDGDGFEPEEASAGDGLGLRGMSERIALLGGAIEVTSRPGAGTTIEVRVPSSSAGAERP